jgi:hypothetical protein
MTAAAAASAVVAQVHSGRFEQIYYLVELGSAGLVTQGHGARAAADWFRSPAALVQSGARAVSPADFVLIAVRTGLIILIGRRRSVGR